MRFATATMFLTLCLVHADGAGAAMISYTATGIGTGSLGTNTFTDARITLSTVADSDGVELLASGIYAVRATTTVAIEGVGSGVLTGDIRVLVNQGPTTIVAGFTSLTTGFFVFGASNAAFQTYDLKGPFGPVTGPRVGDVNRSFGTSAGAFRYSATGPVTFTATAAPTVPEPSSLALLGAGAIAAAAWSRRRP